MEKQKLKVRNSELLKFWIIINVEIKNSKMEMGLEIKISKPEINRHLSANNAYVLLAVKFCVDSGFVEGKFTVALADGLVAGLPRMYIH